jgi:hypothetical protein
MLPSVDTSAVGAADPGSDTLGRSEMAQEAP